MVLLESFPTIRIVEKDPNTTADKFGIYLDNLTFKDGVTHVSTTWLIRDKNNNNVIESIDNTEDKTKFYPSKDILCINKEYDIKVLLKVTYEDNEYVIELNPYPFVATINIGKNCESIDPTNYVEVLQMKKESAEAVLNELLTEKVAYTIYVTLDTVESK